MLAGPAKAKEDDKKEEKKRNGRLTWARGLAITCVCLVRARDRSAAVAGREGLRGVRLTQGGRRRQIRTFASPTRSPCSRDEIIHLLPFFSVFVVQRADN